MFELENASEFIDYYQKAFRLRVYKVNYSYKGEDIGLLCVKKRNKYVSLPILSLGAFERDSKNYISVNKKIEIRDRFPSNQNSYNQKILYELSFENNSYSLPSDIKRKVNKAIKNNIQIRELNNWNKDSLNDRILLNDFYKVYSKRMHSIGVPVLSKKQIIHRLESKRYALFIAYYYGKPIGGASLNKITSNYYENELIATNPIYNELYTSYLLHYSMIKHSKKENAITYSMGRSSKDSKVSDFKKHWKGEEIDLYWTNNQREYLSKFKTLLQAQWKNLPYSLTLLIGPLIHKIIN